MLGKPPSFNNQGIGFTRSPSATFSSTKFTGQATEKREQSRDNNLDTVSVQDSIPSSDYDDLADFDGRFESRSTLHSEAVRTCAPNSRRTSMTSLTKRKGIFRGLLGSGSSQKGTPEGIPVTGQQSLRSLRSIGSLRGSAKSSKSTPPSMVSQVTLKATPALPPLGLDLDAFEWPILADADPQESPGSSEVGHRRPRRSVSLEPSRAETARQRRSELRRKVGRAPSWQQIAQSDTRPPSLMH